ncbi:hypothetical protein OG571_47670 (plasmid) [Streptomyces sp. NBC_01369]|uniref:hypothetical protein n=1 Tax=Streptomyces sp. NBC_01369 TaxID=2903842 RepID=UPI002F90C0B8
MTHAERLADLINEIEQTGHRVDTDGSSIVVDDVRIKQGRFEGDPWVVKAPSAPDPRFRVTIDAPERYLRSLTGVLHLRADMIGGGKSTSYSRCGIEFPLGRGAIPLKVGEGARVCKRCHKSEA